MAAIPFVVPLPPIPLPLMNPGHYGISYDIYTGATEHNLPYGWNSNRSGYPERSISKHY